MIKQAIILLAILFSGFAYAKEPIVLNKDNMVILRGEIDGMMLAKTMVAISELKTDNPILFIQSPGGSVDDGLQFIQFMKTSGKKFTCIADMAASMAFAIFQACDQRYVMDNSTIMQHQASFGMEGSNEKVKAQFNNTQEIITAVESLQAKRIGKSLEQFRKDTMNDLWLYGKSAIPYGAADKLVDVSCSNELWSSKVVESVTVLIFKVNLVFSGCPLARAPLSADADKGEGSGRNELLEKVQLMWNDFPKAVENIKHRMFK